MKISEMITDKYKLRIPPTVYYELLADVQEAEEEQEPTTKNETLVSLDVYKQVAWERDIAIQQLHELGYEFGEKIEPITKNDLGVDCISRDSAIKALDYDIKCFEFKSGVSEHMDDIAKLLDTIYEIQVNNIKALPSVTPQKPRKGHWIRHYAPFGEEQDSRECSYCGVWLKWDMPRNSFCPNCGADMREVEDGNDDN